MKGLVNDLHTFINEIAVLEDDDDNLTKVLLSLELPFPTRHKITHTLEWLVNSSEEGGSSFLYYSGHVGDFF